MKMLFKHQTLSTKYIGYLKPLETINWRKTTALFLCLMLAFGHIPASSATLSEQVMDSIVGYGISGSSVETTNTENSVADTLSGEANGNASDTNLLEQTDEPVSNASEQVVAEEKKQISDDVEVKDTTNQKEEPAGEPVKETEIEIKTPLAEPALTEKEPSPEQLAPSGQSEQAGIEPKQELTIESKEIAPVADGMVLQSTAYTCGPAALATLLKLKGSSNNYYEKITQLAQINQNGSSLLVLKRSAEALGYSAAGYRKTIDDLAAAGPELAHVVIGDYHHFTVVEGMADGYVFLADPTLGRIAMPIEQFKGTWSGAVLKVSKTYTSEPLKTKEAQTSVESTEVKELTLKEQADSDKLHIIAKSTEKNASILTDKFTEIKEEQLPSSEEVLHETLLLEKPKTETPSIENRDKTPLQEIQLDRYIGKGLNKDIPAETIEESKSDVEPIIQPQSVPPGRLAEADMEEIKGRAIFLTPLAVKAAIKAAPIIVAKVAPKIVPVAATSVQTINRATEFLSRGPANTHVYYGIKNEARAYVGITKDVTKRAIQHGARFERLKPITAHPVTRGQARAIEQAIINNSPNFTNIRNSISPIHSWHSNAVSWGQAWLRNNGIR
jgi:predicted double-glycine peptidase